MAGKKGSQQCIIDTYLEYEYYKKEQDHIGWPGIPNQGAVEAHHVYREESPNCHLFGWKNVFTLQKYFCSMSVMSRSQGN